MLDFRRMNDRVRFAIFPVRASACRTGKIGLDFFVNRAVKISGAHIGIEHGLVLCEFFCAGRVLGQGWPHRARRALGNRVRDRRPRRRLITAAKGDCGKKKGR